MGCIRVMNPGMYSTVQDFGRTGYQEYGMPLSGSMDQLAHEIANLLVGNKADEAVLEMTILGGTFKFDCDTYIAITGAEIQPILNRTTKLGMWRTLRIRKGDQIRFGAAKSGCRYYMAVANGFKIPEVMGSKSTYVRGKIGGIEGRTLQKGDELPLNTVAVYNEILEGRFIKAEHIPTYKTDLELRVILGPQDDAFTRKGIADFFSSTYTVSKEFDRMGYRLEGKVIEHVDSADIISDGIVKGAIQIPGHGNPIIMLSDAQTTGGYTKIAHVISSDLWQIGQAKTGDKICFKAIEVSEAHQILKDRVEHLQAREEWLLSRSSPRPWGCF